MNSKTILIAILVASLLGVVGWVKNLYKLVQYDFNTPLQAETIRTVGVFVPPVGAIIGYIEIEDK